MENTALKTVAIVTVEELNAAKSNGSWPLAHVMIQKNAETGVAHYVEIVSDVDAPWITKGGPNVDYTNGQNQTVLSELKHAMWAAVEVFHQHKLAVHESGLHLFAIDETKPEAVIGAVASWCQNPIFAQFAPSDGWKALRMRKVAGNVRYIPGDWANDDQSTKYDYEDMLLGCEANFRLFLPAWLSNSRMADGNTWIGAVINALTLEREESIAESKKAIIRWSTNQSEHQQAARAASSGKTIDASKLVVPQFGGGTIDVDRLSTPITLYCYTVDGDKDSFLCAISYDGSTYKKGLVAAKRHHFFSLDRK